MVWLWLTDKVAGFGCASVKTTTAAVFLIENAVLARSRVINVRLQRERPALPVKWTVSFCGCNKYHDQKNDLGLGLVAQTLNPSNQEAGGSR